MKHLWDELKHWWWTRRPSLSSSISKLYFSSSGRMDRNSQRHTSKSITEYVPLHSPDFGCRQRGFISSLTVWMWKWMVSGERYGKWINGWTLQNLIEKKQKSTSRYILELQMGGLIFTSCIWSHVDHTALCALNLKGIRGANLIGQQSTMFPPTTAQTPLPALVEQNTKWKNSTRVHS